MCVCVALCSSVYCVCSNLGNFQCQKFLYLPKTTEMKQNIFNTFSKWLNVSYTFAEYKNFLTWTFYTWIFSNTKISPITLGVGVFCICECLYAYVCVSNMTAYVRLCVCVFVYVFLLCECMYTCVYVTCECVYVWVCMYRRTGNFRGWKFSRFHDSMYYVNISRFLFSRLEVTAKISLLSNSPTCALNRTHGGQRDGSAWKAKQYIRVYHVYSTIWIAALREGWTCWPCATC